MVSIHYFCVFLLLFTCLLSSGDEGWQTFRPLVFVFGVIPFLDIFSGHNTSQPDLHKRRSLWFDVPLWLWVPGQLFAIILVLGRLDEGTESIWSSLGLVISLGIVTGVGGINIAHELMHRKSSFQRALAELLMLSVNYPHFCIEHVHGHHRYVATPRDPATARLGEHVFAFILRSVICSAISAWKIEAKLCERKGIPWWSLKNRRLRYPFEMIAMYWLVGHFAGVPGMLALLGQGVVAFCLLEVINYVEHYGLMRREIAPGKYERVQPYHSWNSTFRLTNWFLFNLQRHSDHHYLASRPYDQLQHHEQAPQLPLGYATMVLLALIPPLWFKIMDPKVKKWQQQFANY